MDTVGSGNSARGRKAGENFLLPVKEQTTRSSIAKVLEWVSMILIDRGFTYKNLQSISNHSLPILEQMQFGGRRVLL